MQTVLFDDLRFFVVNLGNFAAGSPFSPQQLVEFGVDPLCVAYSARWMRRVMNHVAMVATACQIETRWI